MLIGGIAAVVVVSSALALGGSAPAILHTPGGFGRANDGGAEKLSGQEQETGEGTEDGQGSDKVAQAIADEFGVSKEEVLAHHQQGIGFGALFKLYKLARAKGISVDDLLATIPTDANGQRDGGFVDDAGVVRGREPVLLVEAGLEVRGLPFAPGREDTRLRAV